MNILSDAAGVRLDVFLAKQVPGYSRGYFQKLIKNGGVTVNGKAVNSHYDLKMNDQVAIIFSDEKKELVAEKAPLDVIFEDDDLLIVNKAPGLVVHPACGHYTGTLLNHLAGYADGEFTPLMVHRLDKDTSGVIVIAKNERAKNSLVKQFQNRTVHKVYRVAVNGFVAENKGRIEAPLGRDPEDRKKIVVGPLADKMAITDFTVIHRSKEYSLLEVHPVTGRTHQIRSHMVYIGHPVLGDATYGGPELIGSSRFTRQMLHAYAISLSHPSTHKTVTFTAPLPADMEALWKKPRI